MIYKGWVDAFFNDRSETRIVEVGVYRGDFAVRLMKAARLASPQGDIHYTGIDLFKPLDDALLLKENSLVPWSIDAVHDRISKDCPFATINLYSGDSASTLQQLAHELSRVDLIYIDAGHSVDSIGADWNAVRYVVAPGTLIVFDDYYEGRVDCGAKPIVDSIDVAVWEIELTEARTCETRLGTVNLRQALVRRRERFRPSLVSNAKKNHHGTFGGPTT